MEKNNLLAVLLLSFVIGLSAQQKRPNIVVILSDDVGFEEFGIYNVQKDKPSNTPVLDKLGNEGVTFKTAYGQSICGPSRAMFYSGNYAAHTGAYDNKIFYQPENINGKVEMDRFPNFIKVLHDAGYKTAVGGKWHNPIGGKVGKDNELLGVDEYIVYNSSPKTVENLIGKKLVPDENWEIAAISKQPILSRYWKPAYIKNGTLMNTTMKDYGPDLLTDFICDFITDNAKSAQPFLAFYPMVLAHSSHCVTPIDVANGEAPSNKHYPSGKGKGAVIFRNQIKYADQLIGKIIKTIEATGEADNTIIIYASDNGTTASAKGKGVEYGVHIPFIVAGAGIKQRGMTDELIDFTDVLPTIADFANAPIPEKYPVDGKSAKDFLLGKTNHTKDVIYAQPGVTSMVRTKDFLLECVTPLYGYPKGRFYKTNGSYDGRGYENITHDPKYKKERAEMEALYQKTHTSLPESFDDPAWQTKVMKRGLNYFNNEKKKQQHLSLPLHYKFYSDAF